MSDTPQKLAAQFNDPNAKPVFIRAKNSLIAGIGRNLVEVLGSGLDVFTGLQKNREAAHEQTLQIADNIDTISQYITEAVAGHACMGQVQTSMLNMFRLLPDCYLDQMGAEHFEQNMGIQAHTLMTSSTFLGPEATQEARDKLVKMHKYFGHWERAIIDTNASVIRLRDIEERFLDMALESKFGGHGTAGTGNNPLIGILNEIREECETLFRNANAANVLYDHLKEHTTYYKAAINKLVAAAAPAEPFVPPKEQAARAPK